MKIPARSVRMTVAAAAIVTSAATVPASALAVTAAPARPAQARHTVIPRCRSFNITIWLGLGNGGGAAGTIFYPLEFSNTSRRTCFLFGYPVVFAVSMSGRQIGLKSIPSGPRRLVVLKPGQTGHADLGIVAAGNIAGCQIRNGAFLKVFAPHQAAFTIIPSFTFTACANKSVLRISTVLQGTGIPGLP